MKIFPSGRLSDAEFVNKVRKQLQRGKRWGWFMLVISCFFMGLVVWFLAFVINSFGFSDDSPDQLLRDTSHWFHMGVALGLTFGVLIGLFVFKMFFYFFEAITMLFGNRRDKLLVAYYDQLHPLETKAPAPSTSQNFSH